MVNLEALKQLQEESVKKHFKLVAVSKTKPVKDLLQAYDAGQKIFGENRVQEMTEKYDQLPKDIEWHMIGTLQTNKVKYIAPFVSVIHSADSFKLLQEIDKQAKKNNRIIDCLLEVFIAKEDTKHGFSAQELENLLSKGDLASLLNIRVCGLMGMATNTDGTHQVRDEFKSLRLLRDGLTAYNTDNIQIKELSMGMTSDYKIAIEEGSTMIRVGSFIFGDRA